MKWVDPKSLAYLSIIAILLTGLVILETVTQQDPQQGETEVVRIGVLSPTTEENEFYEFVSEVAERDINTYCDESDIYYRFEFVPSCAGAEDWPGRANELTVQYHQEGIDLVIGYGWSTVLCHGIEYANENGMVLISPFSPASSEHLSQRDNVFRLYPHDVKLALPLARIVEDMGVTKVIIIQRDDSWGDAMAEEFMRTYDGGEIVSIIRYPSETSGEAFEAYADELWYTFDDIETDREHRGVVLLSLDEAVDILDAADCWTGLVRAPWFWAQNMAFWDEETWQTCSEEVISKMSYTATKVRLFSPKPHQPETETYIRLSEAFSSFYDEVPRLQYSTLYDACWITALSVIEVDSSKGTAVREVLPDVAEGYNGASGQCLLDENGDRESFDYDIWAFIEEEGSTKAVKFGVYDHESDQVERYYSLLHPLEEVELEEGTVYVGAMSCSDTDYPEFEFLVGIAERDINAYCRSVGVSTEFRFLLNSARGFSIRASDDIQIYRKIGIDLVVGSLWTSQLCACRGYALENGMVLMSSSSTSPILAIYDCIFRLAPHDLRVAYPIAEAMEDLGVEEVVILQLETSFMDEIAEEFTRIYEGTVVATIRYSPELLGEGFRKCLEEAEEALIKAVDREGAGDVALLYLGLNEVGHILKISGDYPTLFNVTWFGCHHTANLEEVLEDAGEEASRVKLISPQATYSGGPTYDGLNAEYEALFGESMDLYDANLYDECWIMALSVLQSNSTSGLQVQEALPEVASNYTGVSGRCLLDENGDRLSVDYALWGYFEVDGTHVRLRCGTYSYENDDIDWDEILMG